MAVVFCMQLNSINLLNEIKPPEKKSTTTIHQRIELPHHVKNSRILILGGTGRVGGSTALALSKMCPDLRIVVGGRNRDKGASVVGKVGSNSEFSEVDVNDDRALDMALKDVDVVVHTAGPFQQAEKCNVLEAAIRNKTAYLDVCDDTSYSVRAKSYMKEAANANVRAITTGGICPGVSNVMAAELVRTAGQAQPQRLRFYYYTAGSGGTGPTILATSFFLLGEEVIAYNNGRSIKLTPYSGMLNVNFGLGIGKRDVYLLNLPEVRSTHEVLKIPTVSARFGTSPVFWNWGMAATQKMFPPEFLRDRSKVKHLVAFFEPLIREVDKFVGEKISMRVDLELSDGRKRVGIFSHRKLSESVGFSAAAFVLAMLEGSTQPGVWFPEEPEGISIEARETFLNRAAQGTFNFVMNKAPKELFGIHH